MLAFGKKVVQVDFGKTVSLIKVDMSFEFINFYFPFHLDFLKNLNNLIHAIQEQEVIYF
jgi:hypothetical protein